MMLLQEDTHGNDYGLTWNININTCSVSADHRRVHARKNSACRRAPCRSGAASSAAWRILPGRYRRPACSSRSSPGRRCAATAMARQHGRRDLPGALRMLVPHCTSWMKSIPSFRPFAAAPGTHSVLTGSQLTKKQKDSSEPSGYAHSFHG
jgi:hypothetical protein